MQFYRLTLFYKLSSLSIWHVKMWKNYAKHVKDLQTKERRNSQGTSRHFLTPSKAFDRRGLLLDNPQPRNMSFIHEICEYFFLFWSCRIKVHLVEFFFHFSKWKLCGPEGLRWEIFTYDELLEEFSFYVRWTVTGIFFLHTMNF